MPTPNQSPAPIEIAVNALRFFKSEKSFTYGPETLEGAAIVLEQLKAAIPAAVEALEGLLEYAEAMGKASFKLYSDIPDSKINKARAALRALKPE